MSTFIFPRNAYASASWVGGTDSNWTTCANWIGGTGGSGCPGSSDDVTVDATTTVNLSATTTIRSLTLGDGSNTHQSVLNFSYDAISNGALVITGGSLTVNTGSNITHSAGTSSVVGTIYLNITSGSATINGTINTNTDGFQHVAGTGAGGNPANNGGGGGAYGGGGGGGANASGGSTYGSMIAPTSLGSGGGDSHNNGTNGGAGGGAVKLTVSGTTTVTGTISANGGDGGTNAGGGSGGSILMTTGTLSGSGSITSNGGVGNNSNGGGGGGGRIYISYTSDSSSLSALTAYGNSGYAFGGAGTIFKKSAAQTNGALLVDNNSQYSTDDRFSGKTPIGFTQNYDTITIQNDGDVETTSSTSSTVTTLTWSTSGILTDDGGTFSPLSSSSDVTIPATAIFQADSTRTFNSLTVNGTLTHRANQSSATYQMILTITANLTIGSGGTIDISARGYQHAAGTGAGGSPSNNGGGGGGYGGAGGAGANASGGGTYGSSTAPTTLGSGGGDSNNNGTVGGAGGGAMQITVTSTTTVTGTISANGGNGGTNAGGGSGGSIYLTTGTMAGAGTISSNGGTGNGNGGGGGGGRIALIVTTNNYTGSVTVTAGTGYAAGTVGTIYPSLTPTVVTNTTTGVGSTVATGNGNLTATEFYPITQSGHLWSSSINPPTFTNVINTPVLHFKMDETSWNGTSGEVTDSSGNGNSGTFNGGSETLSSGLIGNAGSFNGSSQYIQTSYVFPTTNFSYSFWAKSASSGVNNRPFGAADITGGLNGTSIIWGYSSASHIYVVLRKGSNVGTYDIDSAVSGISSGWHHVVVTVDSTNGASLYWDGSSVGTNSLTTSISTGSLQLRIGHDANQSGSGFNGSVDDTRVYNFVLSSSQVSTLYNSGSGSETNTFLSYDSKTQNGSLSSIGAFTSSISGLTPSSTNYTRAYVTDNFGSTYYGAVDTFTTTSGNPPTSLGPSGLVGGGYTVGTQPTLTFSINDSGIGGNAKYEIQIDTHSNFSSPVVDYTSAATSQGSMSFTVGQAAGSGSYTTGNSGQTLTDGSSYYWRVKATYTTGPYTSAYATANSGSVAFIEDTTAPTVPGTPSTISSTNTPTWTWSASSDSGSGLAAVPYTVSWSQDSTFSSGVSTSTSSTNSFTHSIALADGTWYFKVKATDVAGNVSAYSSNGSFKINTSPPIYSAPGAAYPAVCTNTPPVNSPFLYAAIADNAGQISIYSTNITDSIDHYVIEYGLISGNYTYSWLNAGSQGVRRFSIGSLTSKTTYYFRIRGNNGCASGPWSNEISATTLPLVAIDNLATTSFSESVVMKPDECMKYIVKSGDTLDSIISNANGKITQQDILKANPVVQSNGVLKPGTLLTVSCPLPRTATNSVLPKGGTLTVIVYDENKHPIAGADVKIHSQLQQAITDKDGKVVFNNIESGEHVLSFNYKSYSGEEHISVTPDVKEYTITVILKPEPMTISVKILIGVTIFLLITVSVLSYFYIKTKKDLKKFQKMF